MDPTNSELVEAVRERFAKVARTPDGERKFPVGPTSKKTLGYDPNEIDALPASATDSFCGVGNPLSLGEVRPGQTVLDLGSGAGLDGLLAARRVGPRPPWASGTTRKRPERARGSTCPPA